MSEVTGWLQQWPMLVQMYRTWPCVYLSLSFLDAHVVDWPSDAVVVHVSRSQTIAQLAVFFYLEQARDGSIGLCVAARLRPIAHDAISHPFDHVAGSPN